MITLKKMFSLNITELEYVSIVRDYEKEEDNLSLETNKTKDQRSFGRYW